MPITYALLLCIPIGLLYYFGARWLVRFFLGLYEQKERRAAYLLRRGFGGRNSGKNQKNSGHYTICGCRFGLIGPLLKTLMEGK